MDRLAGGTAGLRYRALKQIGALCASSPIEADGDLDQISARCVSLARRKAGRNDRLDVGPSPMGFAEVEAVLALCTAAEATENSETAAGLANRLADLLVESVGREVKSSIDFGALDRSAWHLLALRITGALLSLAHRHPATAGQRVSKAVWQYSTTWAGQAAEVARRAESGPADDGVGRVLGLVTSLIGFATAVSESAGLSAVSGRPGLLVAWKTATEGPIGNLVVAAVAAARGSSADRRRLSDWNSAIRAYDQMGVPIGRAVVRQAYVRMLAAVCALAVDPDPNRLLERLFLFDRLGGTRAVPGEGINPEVAALAAAEWALIDSGADVFECESTAEWRIECDVRTSVIEAMLFCSIATADFVPLSRWLAESCLPDPGLMSDPDLSAAALRTAAVLSRFSPETGARLSADLPVLLSRGVFEDRSTTVCAEAIAISLAKLGQDRTISVLYSLGNTITAAGTIASSPAGSASRSTSSVGPGSADSGPSVGQYSTTAHSVIKAMVAIAVSSGDDQIVTLALSMLVQKIGLVGPAVDALIISESAVLSVKSRPDEFKRHLDSLDQVCHDGFVHGRPVIVKAVAVARNYLSMAIKRDSNLFDVYLVHMINSISAKRDTPDPTRPDLSRSTGVGLDRDTAAAEIGEVLSPLASLVAANASSLLDPSPIAGLAGRVRDAWYNIVAHGFSFASDVGVRHLGPLQILADHSPPLVGRDWTGQADSDIRINPVLSRGDTARAAADHRRYLADVLPSVADSDIRALTYAEAVFVKTAHLVEMLRARAGNCTSAITYFVDPRLQQAVAGPDGRPKSDPLAACMAAVADEAVKWYISQTVAGAGLSFSAHQLAGQLAIVLGLCCHRIPAVRLTATGCADRMVTSVPAALCQRLSLFTLLDLLTLLWDSCLERETDEYGWKAGFQTLHAHIDVELSDNFVARHDTLGQLRENAGRWMDLVIDTAPFDVKELLQAYLSHPHSDAVPGRISFGRSFAVQVGSAIPSSDRRLKSIESQPGLHVDAASDFMAQYTSRQRYHLIGSLMAGQDGNSDPLGPLVQIEDRLKTAYTAVLAAQTDGDAPAADPDSLAAVLGHAGAAVGGLSGPAASAGVVGRIVRLLVRIPFAAFSRPMITHAISIWTVVMKANPALESAVLVEICDQWDGTINRRVGMFDRTLSIPDPFLVRHEFGPSSKAAIGRAQAAAHDAISPHLRLIEFLSSHFWAVQLCSPQLRRLFVRLIHRSLDALDRAADHPLVRESHLQVLIFGLDLAGHCPGLSTSCRWRLLDRIVCGGLAWFCHFARFSYGGNRLQIKAEVQNIDTVRAALEDAAFLSGVPAEVAGQLDAKRRLLILLLEHEHGRLLVWLYPIHRTRRLDSYIHLNRFSKMADSDAAAYVNTAWAFRPRLAVRLADRFRAGSVGRLVRNCILNCGHMLLDECAGVEMVLGSGLPADAAAMLPRLLLWAPTNPATAASYLLPQYQANAYIVQYALRSLDSHSVDVAFFFVPQIVQALRYDELGYAERYIVEAGAVSALFAHQIIWNMQANMYRDEDSTVPDPIKPALDNVLDHLVASFTDADKLFHQTEFEFFNEVTGISGKLKPYIKKSKAEKKQKIEEELRKVKLAAGVYLPSNPDGVVVGIDRQSGKPLQSHAKAPFMATFRIRRPARADDDRDDDVAVDDVAGDRIDDGRSHTGTNPDEAVDVPIAKTTASAVSLATSGKFRELWQSAIFKVGDDCRQDVLVLQLISTFRTVFQHVGLDVFVYPYRVTATAPGCGVIDVLPNSISRDMLGREAVNGLHDYFVSKYGGEASIRFQVARSNFVKSMAAYSIISYLLQLKDRHNGNIMVDDAGHIIHIDFGFCFDIAPGGIKFERAPFKLTAEMVAVMGGSTDSQPFVWFEELSIKAFLACRQHCDHFIQLVTLMLDSGLPCFKPNTIKNFRDRFMLHLSDHEAADLVRDLIKKSHGSTSTKGYDYFQSYTNGIPF